jgi:hypothetical protein
MTSLNSSSLSAFQRYIIRLRAVFWTSDTFQVHFGSYLILVFLQFLQARDTSF